MKLQETALELGMGLNARECLRHVEACWGWSCLKYPKIILWVTSLWDSPTKIYTKTVHIRADAPHGLPETSVEHITLGLIPECLLITSKPWQTKRKIVSLCNYALLCLGVNKWFVPYAFTCRLYYFLFSVHLTHQKTWNYCGSTLHTESILDHDQTNAGRITSHYAHRSPCWSNTFLNLIPASMISLLVLECWRKWLVHSHLTSVRQLRKSRLWKLTCKVGNHCLQMPWMAFCHFRSLQQVGHKASRFFWLPSFAFICSLTVTKLA